MGERFLEYVKRTLRDSQIRVETEHPAGGWMELSGPVATVGFRNLDFDQGQIAFAVKVLSPRAAGAEACQLFAVEVIHSLRLGKMETVLGEMEYLSGCDCYCVSIEARLNAVFADDWYIGTRWELRCEGVKLEGITSFRASRDQGRRVIGAFCQSTPVGVTPGSGGWEIELVQWVREYSDEPTEPFTLTLRDQGRLITFRDCRWNREEWEHLQQGLRRTRKGFALKREEVLEWIS